MSISVWAASVGMLPAALVLRHHGIIVDATLEQGVNVEKVPLKGKYSNEFWKDFWFKGGGLWIP